MPKDDLDKLLRTEDKKPFVIENSSKYNYTKREMNSICKALSMESRKYDPKVIVRNINAYIESPDKLERILYSEISNYIYSLEMEKRGIFATNVEKLLLYSLDEKNHVDADTKKIIVKIYDHFQLAISQIENANNIFAASIEDAKVKLQQQVKGVEREYISILGIFASIVLAFVGGITFSTSVLQSISAASIYRLLLTIDFLAFVLINTIYILVKFIFTINDKDAKLFKIEKLNWICLIIAIVVIGSWLFSIKELQKFISNLLPWGK